MAPTGIVQRCPALQFASHKKSGRFTVSGSACPVATLIDDEPDAQPTLSCAVSGTAIQLGTCDN